MATSVNTMPYNRDAEMALLGCFLIDNDIASELVEKLTEDDFYQESHKYILRAMQKAFGGRKPIDLVTVSDELDGDEMLPQAVEVILETKQASVSMLQRRLKLGYARAARIVDEMEEKGIVGPFQGSKPRDILITREQWEVMKSGKPAQMDFDDLTEDDDLLEQEEF